ncbi:MAG: LPS assembly lipoprotein LptE [Verrucomicrobiota bacterium]
MKFSALAIAVLMLASCGYHLGVSKPASLQNVKTIAVPMFKNSTMHPRAESLATSAVAAAIVQDGTYRVSGIDSCDAVLEGDLSDIHYRNIRGARYDTLAPEELANTATLRWTLRDGRDPTKVLATGSAEGSSQLFVSDNLQTAKNNALPEALERAGVALVSQLSNGF